MLGVAVVGKGVDGDAATGGEDAAHLDIAGIHQSHQVLEDDVDAILVEVTVVAETEEIELEALALDHILAGDIVDDDSGEVGLPRLGAQRSELGAVECHEILVVGMLVFERLQYVGAVLGGILDSLIAQQCAR